MASRKILEGLTEGFPEPIEEAVVVAPPKTVTVQLAIKPLVNGKRVFYSPEQHAVRLLTDRPFSMAKFEVSVSEWNTAEELDKLDPILGDFFKYHKSI